MASMDFGSLDNLYKKYLGRSASQDEYSNWVSGAYGATDPTGIEGQIKTSGEAKDYAAAHPTSTTQTAGYQPGPNDNPYTGGWSSDPMGQIDTWYETLLGRDANDPGARAHLQNPGGAAGAWQSIWDSPEAQAYRAKGTTTTGGGGTGGAFDPLATLSAIFSKYNLDPNNPGHGLADVNYFIRRGGETGGGWGNTSNQQYWQDRTAQEIEKALYGKVGNLIDTGGGSGGGGGYKYGPYSMDTSQMFTDPATKMFQQMVMDRIDALSRSIQRPDDTAFRNAALARVDELMKPPYSAADEQALITHMRDPLTQARDARVQQAKEQMGARNLMPTSGLYQEAVNLAPERDYERALATGTNDLAVQGIAEQQARRDKALSILSGLVGLGSSNRAEDQAIADKLLTTGAILPDLSERRLQQLMQVYGVSSAQIPSLMSTLTNIMGLNTRTNEWNAENDANNAAAWGQIFGYLMNSPLFGG